MSKVLDTRSGYTVNIRFGNPQPYSLFTSSTRPQCGSHFRPSPRLPGLVTRGRGHTASSTGFLAQVEGGVSGQHALFRST